MVHLASLKSFALAAYALGLLLGVQGCRRATTPLPASAPTPSASVSTSTTSHAAEVVKLALFQDKTASVTATRTPQLTYEDIEPLINVLSKGAELDLGVGLINDNSDRSLIRLRLAPPPERPAHTPARLPSNPFERLYVAPETIDNSGFDRALGDWSKGREQDVAQFKSAVTNLLRSPIRGCTDIEGALARADLMLAEPEARFAPNQAHRWAIFVTDGLHTTSRHPTTLRSGATLIVVNASGTLGVLERLSPRRFESPTRAIRHVLEEEGQHGDATPAR